MVELSDPKGPVKEGIDNTIFIVPGIIIAILIGLSSQVQQAVSVEVSMEGVVEENHAENIDMDKPGSWSFGNFMQPGMSNVVGLLVAVIPGTIIAFFVFKLVKSLRDKEKAKEEKKKLKQMRKEKELTKKQKKK